MPDSHVFADAHGQGIGQHYGQEIRVGDGGRQGHLRGGSRLENPGMKLSTTRQPITSGTADEVDGYGFAAGTGGVVDPGFDVACVLPGGPASLVERIGNAARLNDGIRGTGE